MPTIRTRHRPSSIRCTDRVTGKDLICRAGSAAGVFELGQLGRRAHRSYVRAINYHGTPAAYQANFARQLRFYAHRFDDAGPDRLRSVLAGDRHDRPAVAVTFDDGYRDNYDVAAPMLEEHGLTGWFFVSPGRLRDLATDGRTVDGEDASAFMSSDELRDLLARGHVVGCHTHSHARLSRDLTPDQLHDEIVVARRRLADLLDDPIDSFCWVGGEEWTYSAAAQARVEAAGYALAFTTNCQITTAATNRLSIDRTNIEANWPLHQVRFYLSGVMDLAYTAKARRVARELGLSPTAVSAAGERLRAAGAAPQPMAGVLDSR